MKDSGIPSFSPAARTCTSCGNPYRGNDRAKAQLCPGCRTHCISCGKAKTSSDSHSECHTCRVASNQQLLCTECGEANRVGVRRVCWRCYDASNPQRNSRFGLAEGQYEAMLKAQHGLCAICLNPEKQVSASGEPLSLSVDHDRTCCPGTRSCGKCVRELTCRNCNAGIGLLGDDPVLLRAAADYIERHRA